jgi:molecular chaperone HscB
MTTQTQNATGIADYFAVFALPRKLNLDESALQQEFYRLSREYHPDRFARASASEQQAAMDKSSQLNDAYRALRDPIKRTQHLLELEGVRLEEQSSNATQAARESGVEKKQVVPPELLEEVFELNMQLQELKMSKEMGEAGDEETVQGLQNAKKAFEERLESITTELKSLWNHWDAVVERSQPGDAGRNIVRDKMVALLNQRSYIRNLVRDVNAALNIQ